jgi:uncharacterized protein YggU (UPF0235/DUF167 family)
LVPSGFFRTIRSGIELFVRLTPHASKDEIESIEATADGREHLAARVRAIPDKGKANAALEKLVAAWLGVARTKVRVTAGATQRLKTLRIEGEADDLAADIQARAQGLGKAKNSD